MIIAKSPKTIRVMFTPFRDGLQSSFGGKVRLNDFLPAMKRSAELGIRHFEFGGGARYQAPYFYLGEDPFEDMKAIREAVGPDVDLQILTRSVSGVTLTTQSIEGLNLQAKLMAESLRATTGLARLWFVVDDADHARQLSGYGDEFVYKPGGFAEKINYAWDVLVREDSDAPFVMLVGDDVLFHPAWWHHGQQVADMYEANVVGTNDLVTARTMTGKHTPHPIIRRSYIEYEGASWDGPGSLCHEYQHYFVDDEIVTKAKQLGVWQPALGAIVEHMHWLTGKSDKDEVYERNDTMFEKDRRTFVKRLKANTGVDAG